MPAKKTTRTDASKLKKLANDAAALSADLSRHVRPDANPDGAFVIGAARDKAAARVRRMELITGLLHKETIAASGATTGTTPVPSRNALAFSWLPTLDADHNSVSVGVPGVGEVSIGADGATASVDGVGGATIDTTGVSVNAGGTSVSVGRDGAQVTVPGAGTVTVGPDGSVSVGAPSGDANGGGGGFPSLPIPQFCGSELKIPIPVPKFVVEPFEIPINVPQLKATPLPIEVPRPTLESKPMPISIPTIEIESKPITIPIPTFDLGTNPSSTLPIGRLDIVMDVMLAKTFNRILGGMSDMFKQSVKALAEADEIAGNPEASRIQNLVARIQILDAQMARLQEFNDALRTETVALPIVITASMQQQWQGAIAMARTVVGSLDDVLGDNMKLDNPSAALSDAVRSAYLLVGWILARYANGTLSVDDTLASRMLKLGNRLAVGV